MKNVREQKKKKGEKILMVFGVRHVGREFNDTDNFRFQQKMICWEIRCELK